MSSFAPLAPVSKLLAAFALASPLALLAQESTRPLGEMSLQELLDTPVTSASKVEQPAAEAPSVISVVPREEIDTYGWNSIDDVLERQPGFAPSQDYDRRTVGSRGLFEGWNNNHLLMLVDGIPVNDNLYGTAYTWEITPLAIARSLEIIRGPGSALYGSNATNGVVQINTVSAEDLPKHGEVRYRMGNDGVRILDVLVGQKGALFSAVAAYSSYQTDGNQYLSLDGSGRLGADGEPQSFLTRDQRASHYFWTKLVGHGALAGLSLQYHEQYWSFQTGHGWLWWIPDFGEAMNETRRLFSIDWKPKLAGSFSPELMARYQVHEIDWNQRYYPNGAFDGYYPAGMWEYLKTSANDLLLRAQTTVRLPRGANVLAGLDADRFLYRGDDEHYSNIDVDTAGAPPFPDGADQPLGPWLDWIKDHPLLNVGAYAQFTSGALLGEAAKVTAGVRYDRLAFDFSRIDQPGRPTDSKSFSQASPRLALVLTPTKDVTVKLMGSRAFRAPAPTELAGAHTFSLASNIDQLRPEVVTTYEGAVEWRLSRSATWRTNVYRTAFDNEIAYSAQNNNLSTNLYSLKTAGLETELLWSAGPLSGFANYAYARRLDESIQDLTIAPSPDALTWAPAHTANAGVSGTFGPVTAALSGHYNGVVDRRASDLGVQQLPFGVGVSLDMDRYRGRYVASWVVADAKVEVKLPQNVRVALSATNLFDRRYDLVKVGPFPFDYRQEGRRWLLWGTVGF